jgi:hypothetical protein
VILSVDFLPFALSVDLDLLTSSLLVVTVNLPSLHHRMRSLEPL